MAELSEREVRRLERLSQLRELEARTIPDIIATGKAFRVALFQLYEANAELYWYNERMRLPVKEFYEGFTEFLKSVERANRGEWPTSKDRWK